MNKWFMLAFTLSLAFLLGACSGDANDSENSSNSAKATQYATKGDVTEEIAQEIIETYGLRKGDELLDVRIEDDEIIADIYLSYNPKDSKILNKSKLSAIYTDSGDEFLHYTGWDRLTMNFDNVDYTVTFSRDEADTNEKEQFYVTTKVFAQLR